MTVAHITPEYLARRQREAEELVAKARRSADIVDVLEEREAIVEEAKTIDLGPRGAEHAWTTPAEKAAKLGSAGPKLATGLVSLDKLCRGGIRAGKVVFVGGAPGSMKTGILTEMAHALARRGVPTLFLASDEDSDSILIRCGQHIGLDRDELEEGREIARKNLVAHLESIPLDIIDRDEGGVTVEACAARLRRRHPEGPAVLFVDSVQTAQTVRKSTTEGRRGQIDALVDTLEDVARRHSLLVIATSELARGAYRSKKNEENVDDLAALKESGSIEYAAHVLLVLHSLPGRRARANVAKNRVGDKGSFELVMDPRTATFREQQIPPDDDDAPEQDPSEAFDELIEKVWLCAKQNPGIGGADPIAMRIRRRKADVAAAMKQLCADNRIQNQGPKNHPRWVALDGVVGGTDEPS